MSDIDSTLENIKEAATTASEEPNQNNGKTLLLTAEDVEKAWGNGSDHDGQNNSLNGLRDAYASAAAWVYATYQYKGPVADATYPYVEPVRQGTLDVLHYLYNDVDNLALTVQLGTPIAKFVEDNYNYVVWQAQMLRDRVAASLAERGPSVAASLEQRQTAAIELLSSAQ